MRKFNKKFMSIILSIIIVITSVSIPVNVSAGSDREAPSAPTNLQAATKTCTSIDLSWTGSTDNVGVTAYYVYRGTTQIGTTTGEILAEFEHKNYFAGVILAFEINSITKMVKLLLEVKSNAE